MNRLIEGKKLAIKIINYHCLMIIVNWIPDAAIYDRVFCKCYGCNACDHIMGNGYRL